ncbi:TPA: toll/interleukin-1 receptor domain-containing protein [Vibrio parahaemolyticus]
MNRVFISHSSADREAARELSEALTEAGISYWLDEQSLLAGSDISAEIGKAIEECSAVVFLLSNSSTEKSWQSVEIAIALAKGKRVFPLVLSRELKVPILLQQYAYLDLSASHDFKKAAFEISRSLGKEHGDVEAIRYDTLKAKRELIERQKEIYLVAHKLKETEMKTRNFSLLFISLCISIAMGLMALSGGIEHFDFMWGVLGSLLGAAAVEIGHVLKRRNESKEISKEVQE